MKFAYVKNILKDMKNYLIKELKIKLILKNKCI